MLELLKFILATSGLSWIAVYSTLLTPFRSWLSHKRKCFSIAMKSPEMKGVITTIKYKVYWFFDEIFNCHKCFSFWSGIINFVLMFGMSSIFDIFVGGLIGLMGTLLVIALYEFLNKR